MNFEFKRVPYNWDAIENELGWCIPESYKDCYERLGAFSIDSFIYIVSPNEVDLVQGLVSYVHYVEHDVYGELEELLEAKDKIVFYDGKTGWMPIGYTTNGDFIFCNDDGVLITDRGFEEKELYRCGLVEFIKKYLNNDLRYEVFPDDLADMTHEIKVYHKASYWKG